MECLKTTVLAPGPACQQLELMVLPGVTCVAAGSWQTPGAWGPPGRALPHLAGGAAAVPLSLAASGLQGSGRRGTAPKPEHEQPSSTGQPGAPGELTCPPG